MQSLLPGSGYQKQLLTTQGQLPSSTAQLQVELLQSQTKLAELEAQVRLQGCVLGSSWRHHQEGGGAECIKCGIGCLKDPTALTLPMPRCGSWSWSGPSTACCWRVCSSGTRPTWSSLKMRTGIRCLQSWGLPELMFRSPWAPGSCQCAP